MYDNNDDRVDGEYHFTSDDFRRASYSDAGYVPTEDASAVPPRYHCATEEKEKTVRSRRRRTHRGMHPAAVTALCLVCAGLGGMCGAGISAQTAAKQLDSYKLQVDSTLQELRQQMELDSASSFAQPNHTPAGTLQGSQTANIGTPLNSGEIYDVACTQVVAIKSEIRKTNIFGYTSSSAVSGSGFVISEDGCIMTNYHVIEDAGMSGSAISVYLYGGKEYPAQVLGYDEDNDIAVLKIDANGLNYANFGDSDSMCVGDPVYAVGNPLGELQYSMTSGIVSALDREISSTDSATGVTNTINMFQIDAAVNSGNSGGPVYNNVGDVIGVVTSKYMQTGVEGLGFAIPINDAKGIARELISQGYVSGKADLGIMTQSVSYRVSRYYNMPMGAYIYYVDALSTAGQAGLQEGDIIVAIDNMQVNSTADYISAKKQYSAGAEAKFRIYRNGKYYDVSVTFDEYVPD